MGRIDVILRENPWAHSIRRTSRSQVGIRRDFHMLSLIMPAKWPSNAFFVQENRYESGE